MQGGLGTEARELWQRVLDDRVLPLLASEIPERYNRMFGRSGSNGHECMEYLGSEPTVNRYRAGGYFGKHRDTMDVSVLCLLDDKGFEGGGTEFWAEELSGGLAATIRAESEDSPPTVRLHPAAGVGVIFHGRLQHAGASVVSGTRYLLVASFKAKVRPPLTMISFITCIVGTTRRPIQ